MSRIAWSDEAWEDYVGWQQADRRMLKRINLLLKDVLRTPFSGIGKPEPLKFELTGYWSRRITDEHRLVYSYDAEQDTVFVIQCKHHY